MYILATKDVRFSKIALALWCPLVNKDLFLCNILEIHLIGHIKIRFSTYALLITQTLFFSEKILFYSCYNQKEEVREARIIVGFVLPAHPSQLEGEIWWQQQKKMVCGTCLYSSIKHRSSVTGLLKEGRHRTKPLSSYGGPCCHTPPSQLLQYL